MVREERPEAAVRGPASYLLLSLGLFYSNCAVILVLLEHAEVADTRLVCLAEELHGLAMQGALAGLKVPNGLQQLVVTEGSTLQVRLEVQLAEGGLAHQAGLDGLLLVADAGVTQHLLRAWLGAQGDALFGSGVAVPPDIARLHDGHGWLPGL